MTAMREKIRIFGLHSQEGAALVIAVLILLTLTVIGIYAVTTSTLDTKISGFHKQSVMSFYAADAGIERTLATYDFSTLADDDPTSFNVGSITYDLLVDYLIDTPPPRGSRTSATKFRAYHFRIESIGSNPIGTASSEIHQWGYRLGLKTEGLVD